MLPRTTCGAKVPLGQHGTIGLIATNTISQGDSRRVGLKPLLQEGGLRIYDAMVNLTWPGAAAVTVSVVHLARGSGLQAAGPILNGRLVAEIDSRLTNSRERPDPFVLQANRGRSYIGAKVYGQGFLLSPDERMALLRGHPTYAGKILPYLGGEEVNTNPDQGPERYAIDFAEEALEDCRRRWPELLAIVESKVRPEREKLKRRTYRENWWRHGEPQLAMRRAIAALDRCLVSSQVTKHLCFSFQPTNRLFSQKLVVIPLDGWNHFAILQSRIHEAWVRLLCSTLGATLNYSPSDSFESYAFPGSVSSASASRLQVVGRDLYAARSKLMLDRAQGLTTTYNQLKNPEVTEVEIVALRRLHRDMDHAVLEAYGWQDIKVPLFTEPVTTVDRRAKQMFEDEIIDRLFTLNAERAEEERLLGIASAAGSGGGKTSSGREKSAPAGQLELPTGNKKPKKK